MGVWSSNDISFTKPSSGVDLAIVCLSLLMALGNPRCMKLLDNMDEKHNNVILVPMFLAAQTVKLLKTINNI